MQWLIEQLAKEWAVIRQAPLSFALACVLSLLVAFFLIRWIYQERLSARDDLISYYKEKLGFFSSDKSRYSGMRNAELKRQALSLAVKLRELAGEGRSELSALTLRDFPPKISEEEKMLLFQKWGQEQSDSIGRFVTKYNQQYRTDVILLRDEMLLRLPPERRQEFKQQNHEESVVNTFSVDFAADKIEKMAKLLPKAGN